MLYLSKKFIDEIIEHSKKEYPNEVCGILAGREDTVENIYRMKNADKSKVTFFMDPKEQLKVMKDIRNSGLEMAGIYHSHPESQAYPSERDVKLAYYPKASYVIVSLKDKEKPKIKSFKIVQGKIEPEDIIST